MDLVFFICHKVKKQESNGVNQFRILISLYILTISRVFFFFSILNFLLLDIYCLQKQCRLLSRNITGIYNIYVYVTVNKQPKLRLLLSLPVKVTRKEQLTYLLVSKQNKNTSQLNCYKDEIACNHQFTETTKKGVKYWRCRQLSYVSWRKQY